MSRRSVAVRAVYTTRNKHVFDNINDPLLLATGQIGSRLEKLAQLACRPAGALLGRLAPDEVIGTDAEKIGQNHQLLGSDRRWLPFPKRISAVSDAELFGNLGLGKARAFAQLMEPRAERRTGPGRWTTSFHVGA